ncbi:sugar transporter SWEET1-like isoform X1 [Stegodyphus dumicola]|uniref:sugar transporter SWEET1-like isoform X1 n=1 Tax=Stegodyphus dumicola TaxID=202533 RepID=UPI0015AD9655|nr:sugar transporter SWEET1-like isoform X1 [Stegodyphus dumicola]
MDLLLIVGNTALICTIASNFAGLPVCFEYTKKKTTSNASVLPFLAGATCCSLWFEYGVVSDDFTLILVNIISAFLQFCYLICFYTYTPYKSHTKKLIIAASIFLFCTYVYCFHLTENHSTAVQILGLCGCISSILTCAAPLASVGQVLKTKSTESLPFPIILASFIVTTLWFFYGFLKHDTFLQIPNAIGTMLSGFQLSLFAILPEKSSKTGTIQ